VGTLTQEVAAEASVDEQLGEPERLAAELTRWTGHYGFDGRPSSELIRHGENLLHQDPQDPEGWALIGRAAHLIGNSRFAAAALARAVTRGSPGAEAALYLARLRCEIGEPTEALANLLFEAETSGAAFVRGICRLATRDAGAALSAFRAAAAEPGEYAVPAKWAHAYLGSVLDRTLRRGAILGWDSRGRGLATALPPERPILTVLDYKSPDLRCCSHNLGDYMQTYAVLHQLAHLSDIDWSASDPALLLLLAELRNADPAQPADSHPAARRGELHLDVLDRDALWLDALRFTSRRVWALIYGWQYHRSFLASAPLPAPDNIEPIVISFHLAQPGPIERGLLDWLRRFEPIGCRDWNTVGWLLNQGVEAFFSGCVTLTLPSSPTAGRHGRYAVDIPAQQQPHDMSAMSHAEESLRLASLEQALRRCRERLALYAGAEAVITSRLHCYLPCRAIGTPVEFRPPQATDRRFEGLVDISDDEQRRMAANLGRWIAGAVKAIATGADPERIRRHWRDATREDVTAARTRFAITVRHHRPAASIRLAAPGPIPGTVHLALTVTPETARPVQVTLASALRHTRARLEATILAKGFPPSALARLAFEMARQCEGVAVVACKAGPDFDRLGLAKLLAQAERVVYVAPGSLFLADVAELAASAPGASGVAARPSPVQALATQAQAIEQRASTLEPAQARRLRTTAAGRLDLALPYFDPAVCVLSPLKLRQLADDCRTLATELAIDEWLSLQLITEAGFDSLPAAWNANPYAEMLASPKLIHWGGPKPWLANRNVLMAELWRQHADTLGARQSLT
jgi:hypothetical protein